MNEKDALKAILKMEGKTYPDVAKMRGISSATLRNTMSHDGRLSLESLLGLLSTVDAELIIRTKDGTEIKVS